MLKILAIVVVLGRISLTVFGGTTVITRRYGTLNPYFNQTSYGTFRNVRGSTEQLRTSTIWMQDDLHKRLRIDIGKRGEPTFMGEFYFFKNETFEIQPGTNGSFRCIHIPDFNYSTEISTYGEPNFGFVGRHMLQEYGGVTADVYAGQAVDGVGPLSCLFYCDSDTCTKFLGLVVMGTANKFSYLEYWFGSNLTAQIPPAYWFNLPEECNHPHTEHFFETHNLDGSMKEKPKENDQGFCTNDKSNEISMVLYRSLCCGIEKQMNKHE